MSPFARLVKVSHWSVATRVVVMCVGIALVFAAATTAIGYFKASAGLTDQGEARLEADAVVITTAVDQWTSQHVDLAHGVANMAVVQRFLEAGAGASPDDLAIVRDITEGLVASGGDGASLSVFDGQGIMRYSQSPGSIGGSYTNRDYFANAIKGGDFVSGVSRKASDGTPIIFISTPVRAANGRIVGVVNASGSPVTLQKIVDAEQQRNGATSRGILLDEQGLIIGNTIDPTWLLRPVVPLSPAALQLAQADKRWGNSPMPEPLGDQSLVPAIGATTRTIFTWQSQGTSYHAVAMPLSQTHWTYVSAMPISAFEAATQDLLRTSALALALGLVLAVVATVLFMRPISAGLRRLTLAAHGLAQGDTQQKLDLVGRDEIGQMADAFRDVNGLPAHDGRGG